MVKNIIEKYKELKEIVGSFNESGKAEPEEFAKNVKEKCSEIVDACDGKEPEEEKEEEKKDDEEEKEE